MKRTSLKKCFWKTLKPFLSDKVQFYEKIKVAEEDDTPITSEKEVSMKLNDFSQMLQLISKFQSFRIFIPCQKT